LANCAPKQKQLFNFCYLIFNSKLQTSLACSPTYHHEAKQRLQLLVQVDDFFGTAPNVYFEESTLQPEPISPTPELQKTNENVNCNVSNAEESVSRLGLLHDETQRIIIEHGNLRGGKARKELETAFRQAKVECGRLTERLSVVQFDLLENRTKLMEVMGTLEAKRHEIVRLKKDVQ
jgi:hypothetical protein